MRMRAAILKEMRLPRPYAASRPLEIAEVDLEPPGPGEILVSIKSAGLCHSDLSVIDGVRPRPLPMVLGHEGAGIVEELGAGVTEFRVGDHVVAAFVPSCGECEPCQIGRPALCEPGALSNTAGTLLSGARRLGRKGRDVNHHLGVSAFAQFAVLSQRSLVRVDKSLPFAQAAVFGCAVITGVGAVVNTAGVPPEARVAVIGLGGVGMAALLGARAALARELIAVDISDAKLALARELGATLTFNARDADCAERLREATRGGVDFAFEMAGSVKAMGLAYQVTRRGGTTVTAGLPDAAAQFAVSQAGLVAEERTIKGSYLGSCDPRRDIPRYIEWFQGGRLPIDRLLAPSVALDDINEGFDRLAEGAIGRQVVQIAG